MAVLITPEVMQQIGEREAEVLGKPPRIPPLERAAVAAAVQETTYQLRKGIVGDAVRLPLEAIPEIMFTLCQYPVWDKVMALSLQMQGATGVLPPRDRELAILRTGWLCQAPYEWGEHVKIGKNLAGVTDEEIERVMTGSTADGWSEHERALLCAVEELHADAMISDETWAVLAKNMNEQQLLELPVLIGQYMGVAFLQNSIRARPIEGNTGLAAR